ncbi:MAG: hypothetical protein JWO28_921 [Hyphomicrobiales bacterium]|nr:hypothetical protein [Hyphomicrobiales bacterium]
MTRNSWIGIALAVVAFALLIYFAGTIWYGIVLVAQGAWWLLSALGHFIYASTVLVLVILQIIAGWLIVALAVVSGVWCVAILATVLARQIARQLSDITKQVKDLHVNFREETRRNARDAAFLAVVGTFCGLVAYMATDEFLEEISTVRFFAVCAVGFAAAKLFMFFPSRIAKIVGVFLTAMLASGAVAFVIVHHHLIGDAQNGFAELRRVVQDPQNSLKLVLLAVIATLSALSILYPMTWSEWRRLLNMHGVNQASNSSATRDVHIG